MITVEEVLPIHHILIENFGGAHGVRDLTLLESALARPYATFAGEDLYPTIIEKAGAVLESILINHPFVDGNKRTAYVLMRLLLLEEGMDINATEEEKYTFVIDICTGTLRTDEIKKWLFDKSIKM